jgi:hypothetical protein
MIGGSMSFPLIEGVGFHQIAVGDPLLQGFHHVPRQYIGAVRLAGVQLDSDPACYALVDFGVDFQQAIDADVIRKEYGGA